MDAAPVEEAVAWAAFAAAAAVVAVAVAGLAPHSTLPRSNVSAALGVGPSVAHSVRMPLWGYIKSHDHTLDSHQSEGKINSQ